MSHIDHIMSVPIMGNTSGFYAGDAEHRKLREATFEGSWGTVIQMYNDSGECHEAKIYKDKGTAMHVAVSDGDEDVVKDLVKAILKFAKPGEIPEALKKKNAKDETPLHIAAARGFTSICEYIIGGENGPRKDLIKITNGLGETPLFLAVLSYHKKAFAFLSKVHQNVSDPELRCLGRNDGNTILHCAIWKECFDLALVIFEKYSQLAIADAPETEATPPSPLKVLATRPLAFKSGSNLSWLEHILYHCVHVDPSFDLEDEEKDGDPRNCSSNYLTCFNFYGVLQRAVAFVFGMKQQNSPEDGRKDEHPRKSKLQALKECLKLQCPKTPDVETGKDQLVPPNYATWHHPVKFVYWCITLVFAGAGINEIRKMKQKHKWSGQLLSKFMDLPRESYYGSYEKQTQQPNVNKKEEEETVILVAAKHGIVEMVDVIIKALLTTVRETTSKKENVLLVAVKCKKPFVVEALQKHLTEKTWDNLIQGVDDEENTVLHLAATLDIDKPWKIPGMAMQMMWDIKWFQYIKTLVPEHFNSRSNKSNKTAAVLFKETHKDLIKESSEWLKETSESCSLVATLIAGVSFATAGSVPGGTEGGKPALEGQPAFNAFAISSLIGLCSSVTSLIMFLSILTSQKHASDFSRDLPLKLLLGLSTLFLSIAAMFVSFSAGHFFLLKDSYNQTLFPIYAATFLPVTFYAVAQFPLYLNLLKVILKKVPPPSEGHDL